LLRAAGEGGSAVQDVENQNPLPMKGSGFFVVVTPKTGACVAVEGA
jgi:hypothetical protein